MVVPLQTLQGWPDVREPTALEVLGLLVGAPLVVILLVAVIARVHHAVKGNVGVPDAANQPIWVNGRQVEPATRDGQSRSAIEGGYDAVSERADRSDDEDDHADSEGSGSSAQSAAQATGARRAREDVGGASARW